MSDAPEYTRSDLVIRRDDPDLRAMVEALQWYAEQARLARLIHSEGDVGHHAIASDGGAKARSTLATWEMKHG